MAQGALDVTTQTRRFAIHLALEWLADLAVSAQNTGEYSLAATNTVGTAISPSASLTVTAGSSGPVMLSLARNAFSEIVVAAPRRIRCQIESTDALGSLAVWNPAKTFTAGSSAFTWFDPASADAPQRLYRVVCGH